MVAINLVLRLEARPALPALEEVVRIIGETHGTDVAMEWAQHALRDSDVDLFFRTIVEPKRPVLRVVTGGKA